MIRIFHIKKSFPLINNKLLSIYCFTTAGSQQQPNDQQRAIDRYTRRGNNRSKISLALGDSVSGFTLESLNKLPALDSALYKLRHDTDCPDLENIFSIVIKNNTSTDNGVAYAVEKMLQCGCTTYGVKDVVEAMKDRSFNSSNLIESNQEYMWFPYRTHISRDFYNLMDVYFSMVFNPRLELADFLEVRGRFMFAGNNPRDELLFKGQLYDESLVNQQMLDISTERAISSVLAGRQHSLTGVSNKIMRLTYEDVKQYHRNHFTTENTILYTYGDLSLKDHSQRMNGYLNMVKEKSKGKEKPIVIHKEEKKLPDLPMTKVVRHLDSYYGFMLCFKIRTQSISTSVKLQILSFLLFDLPDSPLQKWLSLSLPFPRYYGMRGQSFNVGFCIEGKIGESDTTQKQLQIRRQLKSIAQTGFPEPLIQTCLTLLQSQSMLGDGMKYLKAILSNPSDPLIDATAIIAQMRKQLKKKDIFAEMINTYLLNNKQYMRLLIVSDSELTESLIERNKDQLQSIKYKLTQKEIKDILEYRPSTAVQDPTRLPVISIGDYEFIEDFRKVQETICKSNKTQGIKVTFLQKPGLAVINLRFDISDLPEEYFNILQIYCKSLVRVGYKGIDDYTYSAFLDRYIHNASIEFDTLIQPGGGLKLYMFFKIEFLPQNCQFAFNIINGLISRPNFDNLSKLSEAVHTYSSHVFQQVSERVAEYGIGHASSGFNPFLKLDDITFHSRSACGVAIQMLKTGNPKRILQSLSKRLEQLHKIMANKQKLQILVESNKNLKPVVSRYLELILGGLPDGNMALPINIQSFNRTKVKTYFPNFSEGFIFESFPSEYLGKDSPALAILASSINQNMRKSKVEGGCVAYKGSINAYLKGEKKDFLELQRFYFNSGDIDAAKRRLFQNYRQASPYDEFRYRLSLQAIRNYKQALLSVQKPELDRVRQKYIGQALQKQESSLVIMGPRLQNYEGILKDGWTVQRLIEEASLSMQSISKRRRQLLSENRYSLCIG